MPRTDLNLLIILDTLLTECSVSKTAKKLNVTPPAISKSLNKLRESFQDPLLVRSGIKLKPTIMATQLKPQIRMLIDNIESVLNQTLSFNIFQSALTFNISSNDLLISTLNSGLTRELGGQQHNVTLDFYHGNDSINFLRQDNIDIYIGEQRPLNAEIKTKTIHRDNSLIISSQSHALASCHQKLTLEQLSDHPFTITQGKLEQDTNLLFESHNCHRKISGRCPGYLTMIETVLHTNTLAVVPAFFKKVIGGLSQEIKILESKITLPAVNIIQAWHPRHDNSPSHKWLRDYSYKSIRQSIAEK